MYPPTKPASKLKGCDFVRSQVEELGPVETWVHEFSDLGGFARDDFRKAHDRHRRIAEIKRGAVVGYIRVITVEHILGQPCSPELAKRIGDGDREAGFVLGTGVFKDGVEEISLITIWARGVGGGEVCGLFEVIDGGEIIRGAEDVSACCEEYAADLQ